MKTLICTHFKKNRCDFEFNVTRFTPGVEYKIISHHERGYTVLDNNGYEVFIPKNGMRYIVHNGGTSFAPQVVFAYFAPSTFHSENMFSRYQCLKRGLSCLVYSCADLQRQIKLLKLANERGSLEQKVLYSENVEFIARMLNQQILEGQYYEKKGV